MREQLFVKAGYILSPGLWLGRPLPSLEDLGLIPTNDKFSLLKHKISKNRSDLYKNRVDVVTGLPNHIHSTSVTMKPSAGVRIRALVDTAADFCDQSVGKTLTKPANVEDL